MFVYVSIFSFSLLSFIDMSACSVFIAVCLFCTLYYISILCSYCCLLGVLNMMMMMMMMVITVLLVEYEYDSRHYC